MPVSDPPPPTEESGLGYECPPDVPVVATDPGPLVPHERSSAASGGAYVAPYRALEGGGPVPIDRFALSLVTDWQVAASGTGGDPAAGTTGTAADCAGPSVRFRQRVIGLELTASAPLGPDLPAGVDLGELVRVRTGGTFAVSDGGTLLPDFSGRRSIEVPIERIVDGLQTLADHASVRPEVSLELLLRPRIALDAPVETTFTLTRTLDDGTVQSSSTGMIRLEPARRIGTLDDASWELTGYTTIGGVVADARRDDPSASTFLNVLRYADRSLGDVGVTTPTSYCHSRADFVDNTVSPADEDPVGDEACVLEDHGPSALEDAIIGWYEADDWTWRIEDDELTIDFSNGGRARFVPWR